MIFIIFKKIKNEFNNKKFWVINYMWILIRKKKKFFSGDVENERIFLCFFGF